MAEVAAALFQQLDSAKLPPVPLGRTNTSAKETNGNSKHPPERYFATDWNIESKIVLCQQLAEKESHQICKKAALAKRTEHKGWESVPGKKYAPVQGNRDFMKLRDHLKNQHKKGFVEEAEEPSVEQLDLGAEVAGTIKYEIDKCFFVRMMRPTATLLITLVPTEGDPDLYVSTKTVATHKRYHWRSMLMTGQDQIEISPKDPNFVCGNYYITICNRGLDRRTASFILKAHVKSRAQIRTDRHALSMNRLQMKQLKIATDEADAKVTFSSVASGWGKWRNSAPKPEALVIEASRTVTPSINSSRVYHLAAESNDAQIDLKAAITFDMTVSRKQYRDSFSDRARLIFSKPTHAIEEVLEDVGTSFAANASQQMYREGTKLLLSRAMYSKQPHFAKSTDTKAVKQSLDQLQRTEENDSDSEDEILFGDSAPSDKRSLDIDAFVSVGIPPAVLTLMIDSSEDNTAPVDNSTQWLVNIGKNVPTLKEILDASTVSVIIPNKGVLNLSSVPEVPGEFFGFRMGEHLRRIKDLSISGCQNILPKHLLKATAVMVMLETLDISDCLQFDSEDLLKIMGRLPILATINISKCKNMHGLIFDKLAKFSNLRRICSSSNQQIQSESVSRFLGSSTNIKQICLSQSHIFKGMLTPFPLCASLDNLDVSSCGLTIDFLAKLIESIPNLRTIACAHTKAKLPVHANAFFANLSQIHSIDVSFCTWVTSSHLVGLSQSSPHLHALIAAGLNDLRDWVIAEMFKNCGHMHILDLEGWNFSNAGLEALAVLGLELCEVSFKSVKDITIEGIEMLLVGCKNICKLDVTKCPKIDHATVCEAASELCDHYVSIAKE